MKPLPATQTIRPIRPGPGATVARGRTRYRPGRRDTSQAQPPFKAQLGIVSLLCLAALASAAAPHAAEAARRPVQAVQATVKAHSILVVNKRNSLTPAGFEPGGLVPAAGTMLSAPAAASLVAMIKAAAAEGVLITIVSGYRSYGDQTRLYSGYTGLYGQDHTDSLSARPGFSEHQTGLAVDIGNPGGSCALQRCFATTPAGAWAAAHAVRFGFIVRYPDGATAVTGYDYEPWHLRYVGPAAAADIARRGLTLEAYEGMPAAASY